MRIRLANINVIHSAANNGLIDGFGIGIPSSRAVLMRSGEAAAIEAAPGGLPNAWLTCPTCLPPTSTSIARSPSRVCGTSRVSSGDFRSHNGYRDVTVGMTAKLYSGGGDGIDHSSEGAPHGSLPAIAPRFRLIQRFHAKISTDTAWMYAPIELMRLKTSNP